MQHFSNTKVPATTSKVVSSGIISSTVKFITGKILNPQYHINNLREFFKSTDWSHDKELNEKYPFPNAPCGKDTSHLMKGEKMSRTGHHCNH